MTWSTRELAELAGASQKAVRYYHSIGLLDEPERGVNGYKQYGVSHLLRLIQITTLTELGMPLSRVAEVGDGENDALIEELDAALVASIERLQENRRRLALLRAHGVSWQVPADLAAATAGATEADRDIISIVARVLGDDGVAELRENLREPDATDNELDVIADDASDDEIDDLARRLYAAVRGSRDAFPVVVPRRGGPVSVRLAEQAIGEAIVELYRPVQLRVLVRLEQLVRAEGGSPAPS